MGLWDPTTFAMAGHYATRADRTTNATAAGTPGSFAGDGRSGGAAKGDSMTARDQIIQEIAQTTKRLSELTNLLDSHKPRPGRPRWGTKPDEQPALDFLRGLVRMGITRRGAAVQMNAAGYRTRAGGHWTDSNIARMFRRARREQGIK